MNLLSKIFKKTNEDCWHDKNKLPQKMIDGANGKLFGKTFLESDHIPYLLKALEIITEKKIKVLDIGCGHAELNKLISKFNWQYTGCDLDHIIENVAKKLNPNLNYIKSDITTIGNDNSFIRNFDLIIMSAFIDVMKEPIKILENILIESNSYVIIHRQRISDKKSTKVIKEASYCKFSYQSIINRNEFYSLLNKYNFRIISEIHLDCYDKNWKTFLIKKQLNEK